ncbi:unnamed protein product [Paramecium sonneborni]|uniref:Uncharacterized protein n=1 Tax=Paramecium sonneborni TaxID=65129 RepID=A0A8S1R5C7_9CILI|nr:unnamed protein product [Paramecium sonneborni]
MSQLILILLDYEVRRVFDYANQIPTLKIQQQSFKKKIQFIVNKNPLQFTDYQSQDCKQLGKRDQYKWY